MEQYQLVPLIAAVFALLAGLLTGKKLAQASFAPRLNIIALVALILAFVFGTKVSSWLATFLAGIIGSQFYAALIAVAVLSFTSGVLFVLSGFVGGKGAPPHRAVAKPPEPSQNKEKEHAP